METQAFRVDVKCSSVSYQDVLCLSKVSISLSRQVEEYVVDDKSGSTSSIGCYPSSSLPDPLISLDLQNFTPNYVFQHLRNQLHDPLLSRLVSDEILVQAQAQGSDLSQRSLFINITVKLTQKEYIVVPSPSAPSTAIDSDQETCAICLDNFSKTNSFCQLPKCTHLFHEQCLTDWLDRNSCPLCRQEVDNLDLITVDLLLQV